MNHLIRALPGTAESGRVGIYSLKRSTQIQKLKIRNVSLCYYVKAEHETGPENYGGDITEGIRSK